MTPRNWVLLFVMLSEAKHLESEILQSPAATSE